MNGPITSLLSKDKYVEIRDGRLCIFPVSCSESFDKWLKTHQQNVDIEIAQIVKENIYKYESYSVGSYGVGNYEGITLQFVNLLTGEFQHVIYNVDRRRKRTTAKHKKGSLYPNKQFSVRKKFNFYKFWISTGLPLPTSLTRFHKVMGKLKAFYFYMPELNEKGNVKDKILPLVNITNLELVQLSRHEKGIDSTYARHNKDTKFGHIETTYPHINKGLESNRTTCNVKYVKSIQGSAYSRDSELSIGNAELLNSKVVNGCKTPQEQTIDEWEKDYENTTY